MSRTRTGEAGVALIHAIMFIGLLTAVVTVVTAPLLARAHAVRLHAERVQALYAAEAGVAGALAFLEDDGEIPSTIRGEIGVARYEVLLERGGAGAIVIRSRGTCGDQAHVEDRELPASPPPSKQSVRQGRESGARGEIESELSDPFVVWVFSPDRSSLYVLRIDVQGDVWMMDHQ